MTAYMLSYNQMEDVVIDTSVFVGALLSGHGANRGVIRACLTHKLRPMMSNALYIEYESVMQRKKLFETCILNKGEREKLFNSFLSVCHWMRLFYLWRPNLPDEDDNHVLELALNSNASYLVTNNMKDFKGGELMFPDLKIMKPSEMMELKPWAH